MEIGSLRIWGFIEKFKKHYIQPDLYGKFKQNKNRRNSRETNTSLNKTCCLTKSISNEFIEINLDLYTKNPIPFI